MKALMIAALVVVANAHAQPRSYSGTWEVRWVMPAQAQPMAATLKLQGLVGTWTFHSSTAQRALNPCMRNTQPVGVDDYDSTLLVLTVYSSEILRECPDFQVFLRRDGSDHLKGVVADGTGIVAEQKQ